MRTLSVSFFKYSSRLLWRYKAVFAYGSAMFLFGLWVGQLFYAPPGDDEMAEIDTPQEEVSQITPDDLTDKIQEKPTKDLSDAVVPTEKNPLIPSVYNRKNVATAKQLDRYAVELSIEKGDTLAGLLMLAGTDGNSVQSIQDSLRGKMDLKALKLGQKIALQFDGKLPRGADMVGPKLVKLEMDNPETKLMVSRLTEGGFYVEKLDKILAKKVSRSGGVIESSLYELADRSDIPSGVIAEAIRAFSYDVDFQRDIHPGTRFEVLYDSYYDEKGDKVRDGNLLFASLNMGGKDMKIYRFTEAKADSDYFNENGLSVKKALLRTPLKSARVSSSFGMRKHPILAYSKMHKGVDFAASSGTPIYAAGDGTIEKASWFGSYGRYVRVRHGGQYATAYGHLSRFASGIKPGKRVKQGEVIGYVGTTGRSTGPHLHFETLVRGKQVNPMSVKMTPRQKLAGKALKQFNEAKEQTDILVANIPLGTTQLASKE